MYIIGLMKEISVSDIGKYITESSFSVQSVFNAQEVLMCPGIGVGMCGNADSIRVFGFKGCREKRSRIGTVRYSCKGMIFVIIKLRFMPGFFTTRYEMKYRIISSVVLEMVSLRPLSV